MGLYLQLCTGQKKTFKYKVGVVSKYFCYYLYCYVNTTFFWFSLVVNTSLILHTIHSFPASLSFFFCLCHHPPGCIMYYMFSYTIRFVLHYESVSLMSVRFPVSLVGSLLICLCYSVSVWDDSPLSPPSPPPPPLSLKHCFANISFPIDSNELLSRYPVDMCTSMY